MGLDLRNVLCALVLAAFGAAGTASASPQSYPIVCRGGAGTIGVNSQTNSALFYFNRTTTPAGAGIAPGQCAWTDRGVGNAEPSCIQQFGFNGAAWIFPNKLTDSYVSSQAVTWLRNLLSAANFQTLQVYNPGNGCFVVTRVGP